VRQKRRSYREPDDDEGVFDDDLASVNERLDALTRQLERMAQANAPSRGGPSDRAPDRVADALARLDRRLDQVIQEGRAAATEFERARHVPPRARPAPPPPVPPSRGPANWAAQISARQRTLEGGAAPAPAPRAPAPQWAPSPDLSDVEYQLRQINSQISSLHQPYEHALDALRGDLAEIGRALTDAMPRRAVEALEAEVHALSERLDRTRQAGAGAGAPGADLSAIEHELAQVRAALQHLTPAENLGGFQEAVQALSHKIDQLAASAQMPNDPAAFKQLEQAVVSLRGMVSNVASDGTLAQLAAEVRGLAAQFERAAADSSADALAKLEARLGALMESGRAVPPELEGSIRSLSERLDSMQLSQGDQLAIRALEDRIAKLSEKLDASDARLSQLDAVERGLADLLVHLEEMRNGGSRGLRAPQPPEPAQEPVPAARPSPAAPAAAPMQQPAPVFAHSPLDLIPESAPAEAAAPQMEPPAPAPMPRAHTIEAPAPVQMMPPSAPAESRPVPRQMPPRGQQRPIDPNLPPDTPLEPGSGVPRVKPTSAAARIAASEAALGNLRHVAAEPGGKSAAIAAARNAAKAAYLDTPVKVPKSLGRKPGGGWFNRLFKKKNTEAVAELMPTAAVPVAEAPAPKSAPVAHPPVPSPAPIAEAPDPTPIRSAALPPMPAPKIPYDDVVDEVRPSRGRRVLKFLKTLLVAASVAIIVVGTVQTAIEFLFPDKPATAPEAAAPKDESKSPAESAIPREPKSQAPASTPGRSMPVPGGGASAPPPTAVPDQTNSINGNKSFFDPSTAIKLPQSDATNSMPRKLTPPKTSSQAAEALPASISPALRVAALASDPAAEYELGARYAEGRGGIVPNAFEAARWFQRAADAGFAPAQFRLASLHEKGEGIAKDVQAARRLYVAAAEKGHAKAMHNLAVLYAEGIDGKPDYKLAADWFRKAAMYGVTDSQFNLAILYARGIGVTTNLAESYRWFALAASSGDQDAAKKRDEVAGRLDPQTLNAAKVAMQSFTPEREPEDATSLKAPPGGWDHTPAQPAKPRRQAPGATAPATSAH
jgi:localization factor PodJL